MNSTSNLVTHAIGEVWPSSVTSISKDTFDGRNPQTLHDVERLLNCPARDFS